MFPVRRAKLAISRIVATESRCCVMPIAQVTMIRFASSTLTPEVLEVLVGQTGLPSEFGGCSARTARSEVGGRRCASEMNV
ncbi:MAG: hypothetical protein R2705_09710 [Ilumatobacteraceae bacterium]